MIYITHCDEYERLIQAVLIDIRVSSFQDGNGYRKAIDQYLNGIAPTSLIYKLENEQGVLVGFFVYDISTEVLKTVIRKVFIPQSNSINLEIGKFIDNSLWLFDTLDGNNENQIIFETTEYDARDYIQQRFDFVWLDEVERVVQSVVINNGGYTILANGVVVRQDIDDIFRSISGYRVAYKVENKQGVLVGFFVYDIETEKNILFLRKSFKPFLQNLKPQIDTFISSGKWRFDYLDTGFYTQRSAYGLSDYNVGDYVVQAYSFSKLEYTERVVQSVVIDSQIPEFISIGANGNVVRAELDSFFERLSEYRILYKIENKQGVLVGFFASDPCIEGTIIIVRRPYNVFSRNIRIAVDAFIIGGVWEYDLLQVEPCEPEALSCVFTINGCEVTLNGCLAIIDPNKKFIKRYF